MLTARRLASVALVCLLLVAVLAPPARAGLYTLAVSGTISANTSSDATISVGTPWAFELTYDTAAPDLDSEFLGSADPTYGRFKNTAVPAALTYFHFRAGDYEVTLDEPADFGEFSEMLITFTAVHAIDINIHAPALFPQLAGGSVSFHADFNAFSGAPIFANDGLPTNVAIGPGSFDQSTVSLLPASGFISGSELTSLTITAVPEPAAAGLLVVGVVGSLTIAGRVSVRPTLM